MDVKLRGRSEALCRKNERGWVTAVEGGYVKYAQIVVCSGRNGVEITMKSRALM